MSISSKKALEAAKVIVDFCNEQKGCQNCIFRMYGADHWKCNIEAFDLREVLWNIESKKKNNGKKVLIDAAFLPDKETAETVHSLSGWAYKSNSQEQRATV